MSEQSTDQPPSPSSEPPKRGFWNLAAAIPVWALVLMIAAVLGVGVAIGKSGNHASSTQPTPTPTVTVVVTKTVRPQAASAAASQPSTPTPAKPRWTKVAVLSGSTDRRSGYFRLTGAQAKLTYKVSGSMVALLVYVVPKGQSLANQGGFPEVSPNKAGAGSTRLQEDPGRYYLDVSSANCTWTVTILEKR